MTAKEAQSILDEAWSDVLHAKANCDAALAEKQWSTASLHAQKMRWAISDLEHAIGCMSAATQP